MLKTRLVFYLISGICLLISAVSCYADKDYEDLVDITQSDDTIYAIVGSGRTFPFTLKSGESLQLRFAKGNVGVFLTNFRFVAISNTSNGWREAPLKLSEKGSNEAYLSATIALLVTKGRALAFDSVNNRFVEVQLSIRDELLSSGIGDEVAVLVTSGRALGFAAGSSSFAQVRLKIGESVDGINVSSTKATVQTTDRLLTFVAKSSTWSVHQLD